MAEGKMMVQSLAFLLVLVGVVGVFFSNVAGGYGGSLLTLSNSAITEMTNTETGVLASIWWTLSWLASLIPSSSSSLITFSSSAASMVPETLHNESKKTTACPPSCFRPNPVCGVDGITYWCGSVDAECAGVEVDYTGFCDFDSKGTGGKGVLAIQSLLLVHMVWLMLAAFLVVLGVL
eukprot:c13379_g1_i1 orf=202-735(-)